MAPHAMMMPVKSIKLVEDGLRQIDLPPVVRPYGSFNEPNELVIGWILRYHVYSQIAHVRTVLAGLIMLSDAGNVPTGLILSRHIFEWTAQAAYLTEKLEWLIGRQMWKPAFELMFRIDTSNSWTKSHGAKYDAPQPCDEILEPFGIGPFIAAYGKFQKKQYGKSTVDDSYSYLSEYSHPNSACFLQYRDFDGPIGYVGVPRPVSTFGGINGFILEWLMFMHTLLALAKEDVVRHQLVELLTAAVAVR